MASLNGDEALAATWARGGRWGFIKGDRCAIQVLQGNARLCSLACNANSATDGHSAPLRRAIIPQRELDAKLKDRVLKVSPPSDRVGYHKLL